MLVSEKMTRNVACVLPRDSIADARAMMDDLRIHHLPVVEDGRRLVGIVSDRDLYRAPPQARSVCEVMTTSIVTCTASASLADVAERMLRLRIDAMPITGHDGLLIGIVTSTDVLKFVASRDPLLVQESPFWKRDVPESAI